MFRERPIFYYWRRERRQSTWVCVVGSRRCICAVRRRTDRGFGRNIESWQRSPHVASLRERAHGRLHVAGLVVTALCCGWRADFALVRPAQIRSGRSEGTMSPHFQTLRLLTRAAFLCVRCDELLQLAAVTRSGQAPAGRNRACQGRAQARALGYDDTDERRAPGLAPAANRRRTRMPPLLLSVSAVGAWALQTCGTGMRRRHLYVLMFSVPDLPRLARGRGRHAADGRGDEVLVA